LGWPFDRRRHTRFGPVRARYQVEYSLREITSSVFDPTMLLAG